MDNLVSENLVNELATKLLTKGFAEVSGNGMSIKASYDNGYLTLAVSFVDSREDEETMKLIESFEEYIKTLNDDFFLEVANSFEEGRLRELQDMIDSKEPSAVKEAIEEFMNQLKSCAATKIYLINKDIADAEKELSELVEIRDSYNHVLHKEL